MKKDIVCICKTTSEITEKDKADFVNLFNKAFFTHYDIKWFNWKYIDNVYGDSYIVLAYYEDRLVGIRSFWRNDIDNYLCYQPCDTAVDKEFRGMGIFSIMSKTGLEKVKQAFIYNFPNHQALPANLKLGWKINKCCYLKPVFIKSNLFNETKFIDDDYLLWKFSNSQNNKYYYCEVKGESYLLYRRKNNLYYVLGRFNSDHNHYFTKASFPILLNYTDKQTLISKILKNKSNIVYYETQKEYKDQIDVPMFKADFF